MYYIEEMVVVERYHPEVPPSGSCCVEVNPDRPRVRSTVVEKLRLRRVGTTSDNGIGRHKPQATCNKGRRHKL
jgi:hypothetical protein